MPSEDDFLRQPICEDDEVEAVGGSGCFPAQKLRPSIVEQPLDSADASIEKVSLPTGRGLAGIACSSHFSQSVEFGLKVGNALCKAPVLRARRTDVYDGELVEVRDITNKS